MYRCRLVDLRCESSIGIEDGPSRLSGMMTIPSRSMYETFNSQSKNIGELLGGNERARLIVPKFQRGYSWEKKHVEAFWTDVTGFQKESAVKGGPDKYFLGPIVLLQESKDVIHLLDGQQRLATAIVLFSAFETSPAS